MGIVTPLTDEQRQMVEDNYPLVFSLYSHRIGKYKYVLCNSRALSMDEDDIIQVLTMSLIKSVQHYQRDRGVVFSTYYYTVALNDIKQLLRYASGLCRYPECSYLEALSNKDISNSSDEDSFSVVDFYESSDGGYDDVEFRLSLESLKQSGILTPSEEKALPYLMCDLTQVEVAKRLGISQSYVSRTFKSITKKLKDHQVFYDK